MLFTYTRPALLPIDAGSTAEVDLDDDIKSIRLSRNTPTGLGDPMTDVSMNQESQWECEPWSPTTTAGRQNSGSLPD